MHFDTLDYTTTLEKAGVQREQAEAMAKVQAKALDDLVTHELVTKDHLTAEFTKFRGEISQGETKMRGEVGQVETRLRGEIEQLETRLRGEIHKLGIDIRGELQQAVVTLRGEIQQSGVALQAEFRAVKYAAGLSAFSVALILALTRLMS